MSQQIYTFWLAPDWKLINQLSLIDRFGGSWVAIERREGHTLKQLKSIATVRSIGASTRIEGSKMTDDEVAALIRNLEISKLEERDQQEVAGYFEALDLISESYRDIEITEGNLKNLHNLLLKYSEKDAWHKGGYKQVSNEVEATNPDGSKYTIFKTTEPGLVTEEAMRNLVDWYKTNTEAHPLVRTATFIYEFLSIHPFQDGNGRLSRLLATLLLLRQGYSWIEYVSFEHEIENRKSEYYRVLMSCQRQKPGEDIHDWILFFLDCLANIQGQLMQKLETKNFASGMSFREKKIYQFIEHHPGAKSGGIAEKLDIPLPTIKRILSDMVNTNLLQKHGTGAGTHYSIKPVITVKKDLLMRLTNTNRSKEFLLDYDGSFVEIKKIILTPRFDWVRPDEWVAKLIREGLYMQITSTNSKGAWVRQPYVLSSFNNPNLFQPVFTLSQPINIPNDLWTDGLYLNDYPLQVKVELLGSVEQFSFDVLVVYDEG
ncbi:MAG: Fic family protein [Chitinophagaceae bacterium]|nr:Fic family protein [Chitinophagaceae bacterium]